MVQWPYKWRGYQDGWIVLDESYSLHRVDQPLGWWGYHYKHGWVVLPNPTHIRNAPSGLLFVRCRDSTVYDENSGYWLPPRYIWAGDYLAAISDDVPALARARRELEAYQSN